MNLEQSNPLVTVYIPTFNRVELLKRAVESVRQQTYQNLEIIIVDDCSTDGTHEYLKDISKKDSRIRFFLKEKNSGACASRNIAIKHATGQFITGLDDDDYFLENRITLFVKKALLNDNVGFFSSSILKVSEDQFRVPSRFNIFKIFGVNSAKKLLKQNFIGNQVFLKTKTIREAGGFDENLKAWQDLECWYNLLKKKNMNFRYLSIPTQVVDVSHTHERITTRKVESVVNSYEFFLKKHNLNKIESYILRGQLINYSPKDFNFLDKIILFLLTFQFFYLSKMWK